MNLEMETDRLSKNGNITYGGKYSFHPYGATAAAAITAGKMGASCVLCTKLADDMNGNRLKKYYESCGLDSRMIMTAHGEQTGFAVTLYDGKGEAEHYVSKGANRQLTKEDIDEAFGSFPDFFLVPQDELFCAELPEDKEDKSAKTSAKDEAVDEDIASEEAAGEKIPDSLSDSEENSGAEKVTDPRGRNSLALYACNKAMERGVEMIVDYNSAASSLPFAAFRGIKAFIISDETLYKMTGFYPTSEDRLIRSLVSLKSKIPSRYYIVQIGRDTSLVYDGSSYQKVTLPTPDGETSGKMNPTYIGAFTAEYLETKNVVRACTYAGVASLLTHAHDGVLEKIPSKKEVEEYIAAKGIKTFVW